MQTPDELNTTFAIEDHLRFDEPYPGMPRARITTAACTAELFLQGAHLTAWQPSGQQPVLFLSERSAFLPGKAIRGGIPVIFPWFGSPQSSPVHPPEGSASHGFARVWPWTLRFAALAGEDLHLSLTLDHNHRLHATGFDELQLGLDLVLGKHLSLRLSAANSSSTRPFLMEEALHAYFLLGNIREAWVEGLRGTEYLDKTDGFRRKLQNEAELHFAGETDRPYLNTTSEVTLVDPVLRRRIQLRKQGSQTTVVWNPAAALSAQLPDLQDNDWCRFACMETANAAENAVLLQPREAHTMSCDIRVQAF